VSLKIQGVARHNGDLWKSTPQPFRQSPIPFQNDHAVWSDTALDQGSGYRTGSAAKLDNPLILRQVNDRIGNQSCQMPSTGTNGTSFERGTKPSQEEEDFLPIHCS
jgi:hypothetical protein